jgi:nuclear cap-binding protein subunit 1
LTKIILLTIPYAIAASPSGQAALGDLLDKTEIVAGEAANHPLAALVDPYPINGEDKPFGYQSVVELLQKQLREEASHDWPLKCIARAYVPIKEVKSEGENGAEKEASKHTLPALVVPVPIDITKKPLVPETFFTMFADQDIQVSDHVPTLHLRLTRG